SPTRSPTRNGASPHRPRCPHGPANTSPPALGVPDHPASRDRVLGLVSHPGACVQFPAPTFGSTSTCAERTTEPRPALVACPRFSQRRLQVFRPYSARLPAGPPAASARRRAGLRFSSTARGLLPDSCSLSGALLGSIYEIARDAARAADVGQGRARGPACGRPGVRAEVGRLPVRRVPRRRLARVGVPQRPAAHQVLSRARRPAAGGIAAALR